MSSQAGLRVLRLALLVNVVLAAVKILTGWIGASWALVADGIESAADIVSTMVVWGGVRIAGRPADSKHPYGHGKAEPLAAALVALALLGAAAVIAWQSLHEIRVPQRPPEWYTLPVLIAVVAVKELLHRRIYRTGFHLDSNALKAEAWHHRSDALTSLAAAVGIALALFAGERYAAADDWAALVACAVIAVNAAVILRRALDEIMDAAPPQEVEDQVRRIAGAVPGVVATEKLRIRKSGLVLIMDIHVEVDGRISVSEGHDIAHRVKDALIVSDLPIADVTVHVEPAREDGGAG